MAAWTASQVEEVEAFDFQELLDDDTDLLEWEKEFGQEHLVDWYY